MFEPKQQTKAEWYRRQAEYLGRLTVPSAMRLTVEYYQGTVEGKSQIEADHMHAYTYDAARLAAHLGRLALLYADDSSVENE